ncbi:hypothetical protein C8J56DRAFT_928244 [Mycena floridula]|nr:hypothetical protein C8J56DRAFT_928244 [Mycena floridula]
MPSFAQTIPVAALVAAALVAAGPVPRQDGVSTTAQTQNQAQIQVTVCRYLSLLSSWSDFFSRTKTVFVPLAASWSPSSRPWPTRPMSTSASSRVSLSAVLCLPISCSTSSRRATQLS